MKIVMISTLWESVPPRLYGGTENIVSYLTEELVRRGHDITLFASGDSKTKAKLVPTYPRALYRDKVPWTSYAYNLVNCAKAVEHAYKIKADIIHSHAQFVSMPFSFLKKIPIVYTLHGNIGSKYLKDIDKDKYHMITSYPKANYITISNSQRQMKRLNYLSTVYNGIPVEDYSFNRSGEDYMFWLGRLSKKKGSGTAVRIAKKLGVRLILAGKVDWAVKDDIEHFNKEIKPYLKKGQIEYVGEIGHSEKNRLLGKAKLLINPIEWEEPFGLVPVEAMATGTPVVSYRRGALLETVVHQKTGLLVKPNDFKSLANSVNMIYQMEENKYLTMRRDSRKRVEQKFTVEKMVDGYEKAYNAVV